MFSIDLRSRVPIYEQLVHNITEQVVKKVLLPDEPLPSVRTLARDLGINPNTVQKAYHELEQRGIIYHSAGRGSFVAPTEELADAMAMQHLQTLEQEITAARRAGVSKQAVIELLEKLYKEAVDR
ncbi:MAG: GntR family transcriptional regulator [Oscillospiraceae bacterium]|nr:GntR family transcriptional regulator [Oscillospiraceae bacterium]MBQ4538655.1 GntR family transcriptional regulator [Oscillospiraceae bacterium]